MNEQQFDLPASGKDINPITDVDPKFASVPKPISKVQVVERVEDGTVVPGANTPPGSSSQIKDDLGQSLVIEGLGDINKPSKVIEEVEEGQGEHVVCLHTLVKGFVQGRVLRISKLLPKPLDSKDEMDKEVNRREAKRLFALGAIRLATSDEIEFDFVQVTPEAETPESQRLRDRAIRAEKQLKELQAKIASGENLKEAQAEIGFGEFDDPVEEAKGKTVSVKKGE